MPWQYIVDSSGVDVYQEIKTSVCQCEETISELYQRAQKVAPLVLDTNRQPRRHVSAATLCPYRLLNVRL